MGFGGQFCPGAENRPPGRFQNNTEETYYEVFERACEAMKNGLRHNAAGIFIGDAEEQKLIWLTFKRNVADPFKRNATTKLRIMSDARTR